MRLNVPLERKVALNESASIFWQARMAWLRESAFPTCQYRFPVLATTLHRKCNRPGNTVTVFHKPKSLFLCFHLNLHTPNRALKHDA